MATDATGTPTSLGIPTYNVDADSPSGAGANAMMASIDTLLTNRVIKPSSLASGETAVWNGSTFVRSSTTPLGATSIGTGTPSANTLLRGDSTWTRPPSAKVRRDTNNEQLLATGTGTAITFDTEDYDHGGLWDAGAPTRFTIQETGIYEANARAYFASNASGYRELWIRQNGTTIVGYMSCLPTVAPSDIPHLHAHAHVSLNASDYLEVVALQTSGGNLNVSLGANELYLGFWIAKVS